MSRTTRTLVIALVAVAAVAAIVVALVSSGLLARGGSSSGEVTSLDRLAGTYVSTPDGSSTPRPLVEGHPVRLVIADGRIGATAGCNQMGGEVSLDGGHLVTGPLVQTEMACEPAAVMTQEQWVREMLEASPAVEATADRLVLTWNSYTLVLTALAGPSDTTAPTGTPTGDQPTETTAPTTTPTTPVTQRPTPTRTGPIIPKPSITTFPGPGPSKNDFPESPQAGG